MKITHEAGEFSSDANEQSRRITRITGLFYSITCLQNELLYEAKKLHDKGLILDELKPLIGMIGHHHNQAQNLAENADLTATDLN